MLAIDTNVVVRAIVDDHGVQAHKARELIRANEIFVPLTVIIETEWVLRSSYRFTAASINDALERFLGLPGMHVQSSGCVTKALEWMMQGLDFADALHLAQSGDCDAFVTFDKAFVRAARSISGPRVQLPSDG